MMMVDVSMFFLFVSQAHEMCALLILGEIHNATLVNATNAALQMPLHLAARNGLATVVQALLSRGATVLAVDEEGKRHYSTLFFAQTSSL